MNKVDKIKKLPLIFDYYQELLTDIQKNVFNDYYFKDMSLAEIANKNKKSKSTIIDNLKKTEEKLLRFEKKLNLTLRAKKIDKIIQELELKGEKEIAKKLREL